MAQLKCNVEKKSNFANEPNKLPSECMAIEGKKYINYL